LNAVTHIWLPIEIDAAKHTLKVDWKDTWQLSVFCCGPSE
jgi:hypothetical protein